MHPSLKKLSARMSRTIGAMFAAILLCMSTSSSPAQTQATPDNKPGISAAYQNLPMQFEENLGQADAATKFLAHGRGYSIALRSDAATFVLHRQPDKPALGPQRPSANAEEWVRMELLGANSKAVMSAVKPLRSYVNYLLGNDRSKWLTGVSTFAQTRVADLYPGIDLVYYGTQRQLEYDFIVSPGASTDSIRFSLRGATPVLANNGDLVLQTGRSASGQDMHINKPVLYQNIDGTKRPVDGAFTVAANGEVSFRVGTYDRQRALVIDPIISYASYYGGGIADYINGSTLNSANQVYAVGHTYSANLPSTAGELETANPNNASNSGGLGFVTKFSADGSTVLWSTFIGGPANGTTVNGVAVNASDQAYIVGSTGGTSMSQNGLTYINTPLFPITSDALQSLCGPNGNGAYGNPTTGETSFCGTNAFIAKLSSDGKTLLYSTFLGGSSDDEAIGVALDASANIYVTGHTNSTGYTYAVSSNFSDIPSYPVNNHGAASFGVANFPTTSTAFQSNTAESIKYATKDGAGNVIGPADEQAFFSVISADGHSLLYSTLIGGGNLGNCGNGACATYVNAIAVNPQGIAFIGGSTSSQAWPVTTGAFATTCSGNSAGLCPQTGWLAAFDRTKSAAASLLFSTYVTGSSGGTDANGNNLLPGSSVNGITTDSTGNVYATGYTYANNFPTTTGVLQTTCALGYSDGNGNHNTCNSAFVTKLTPNGTTIWSTYYRGTSLGSPVVTGSGIAVDTNNNVYVVASSYEPSVPLKNAISSSPNGTDALLFELNPEASSLVFGTYLGATGGLNIANNSLQLDPNLNAYFTGTQTFEINGNVTFPTTPGAFSQSGFGNSTVSWIAKLITQQQPSGTTLTVSPSGTVTPTQKVTLTATVTTSSKLTGSILPTGNVTFLNGAATVGTGTLNAVGIATYSGTLSGGTYNITAQYAGDAGFDASTSSRVSLNVSSATQTATALTVSPASVAYGTASTLTATVTAGSAFATSGSISFTAGAVSLGTANVNTQGVATLAVKPSVGIYSVMASYAGTYDATLNPTGLSSSVSAGVPLTVTKAASATELAASASSIATGANLTLTATVTTGATGTVTFYNGATSLGTATVGMGGKATLTTSFAAANSYSLTAIYGGDTNYTGSTSTALRVTVVTPGFTVTDSPAGLAIARGSTGSTTITFSPTGGYSGTFTLACGTLPANATCTFAPTTITVAGTAVTDALTIGTGTVTYSALSIPEQPGGHNGASSRMAFLLPGALIALLGCSRRRKLFANLRRVMLLLAVYAISLTAMMGCGSGKNASTPNYSDATPVGTYTIPVTITPGSGVAQTINLNVTVQ